MSVKLTKNDYMSLLNLIRTRRNRGRPFLRMSSEEKQIHFRLRNKINARK